MNNNAGRVVDGRFAKGKEYRKVITTIVSEGECPFCPKDFHRHHKHPILKEKDGWFVTRSSWPYKNSQHHFLIIGKRHRERLEELKMEDLAAVHGLANWAIRKFRIPGGALMIRFGDTNFTGATVCHIHFHLISPKLEKNGKAKTVNFPVG